MISAYVLLRHDKGYKKKTACLTWTSKIWLLTSQTGIFLHNSLEALNKSVKWSKFDADFEISCFSATKVFFFFVFFKLRYGDWVNWVSDDLTSTEAWADLRCPSERDLSRPIKSECHSRQLKKLDSILKLLLKPARRRTALKERRRKKTPERP